MSKWEFDIAVGQNEEILKISEILKLADGYSQRGEYQAARILYTRACSSDAGKLALARFYLKLEVRLDIPIIERKRRAEQILLEIEDSKSRFSTEACSLLAELYTQVSKYVSAIGYRLRAERICGTATTDMVSSAVSALQRQPITVLEEDSHGAYILAAELGYYEGKVMRQWERCLLQAAAEYGKGSFAGIAAHCLSEIYSEENSEIAERYRILASRLGNPEILSE